MALADSLQNQPAGRRPSLYRLHSSTRRIRTPVRSLHAHGSLPLDRLPPRSHHAIRTRRSPASPAEPSPAHSPSTFLHLPYAVLCRYAVPCRQLLPHFPLLSLTARLRRPPISVPSQRGSPTAYPDVSHSPMALSPQLPFPLARPTLPCASLSRASSKAPSCHFFFIRSPPRSFRADTGHLLPHLPLIFPLLASHSHPARLNMRILLPSVDILVRTPPRSLQHGRNAWRVAVLCTF